MAESPPTPEESEHAAAAHRRDQRQRLVDCFQTWITDVYDVQPNLNDGKTMSLEVTAGSIGFHPRHDFPLFDFRVKTTQETEDY